MAQEPLKPVYVIWGEDRATIDRALARLIARVQREGGMAPERTALMSISRACWVMVSGLSSTMSFGGVVTPGQNGSLVWHMLQRNSTMS